MNISEVYYIFGDKERGYLAYKFDPTCYEALKEKEERFEGVTYKITKPPLIDRIDTYKVDQKWISDFYEQRGLFPMDEKEKILNGEEVEFWIGCNKEDEDLYDVSELIEENGFLFGQISSTWKYLLLIIIFIAYLPIAFWILSLIMDKLPNKPF